MPRVVKKQRKTSYVSKRWCGLILTEYQKLALTSWVMDEFKKPVKDRKTALQLAEGFKRTPNNVYKLVKF